ncbi:MAG: hypothetical protein V4714_20320 [Bacteroidota bacterium]
MTSLFRHQFLVCILVAASMSACSKKSTCPQYLGHWPGSNEKQEASDGKKSAGENLNKTEGGAREVEFAAVRVKRDKNGVVTKKQPKKPKKKTKL